MSLFRSRIAYAIYALAAAAGGAALLSSAAPAQTATTIEGRLSVIWADPTPGAKGGATFFNLTQDDGVTIPLNVAPQDQAAVIRGYGKRVAVQRPLAPQSSAIVKFDKVSVIETPAPNSTVVAPAAATTKRVLFVLLKFAGDAQTPHPPAFYRALTNPLTPSATYSIPATINGYFSKTSWNQLTWQADVVGLGGLAATQWLTLPRTKAAYANCGWSGACADVMRIANDALTLVAAQGVNVAAYSNINFVMNNDLDCCAWGGGFYYQNRFYGATWEPPWGQNTGIYVHEMGHSLGLPHSGWSYFAYDSPWDDMSRGRSAQNVLCGSYTSANSGGVRSLYCDEPGSGYITAHKDALAWIPAANKVTVSAISTRYVNLEADSAPLGLNPKIVKICLVNEPCTGSTAHFLTVESRINTLQYEKGLPGEGVLIHDVRMNRAPIGAGNSCYFNTQSGWAMPIDSTAGDYRGAPYCDSGGRAFPNYALFNAQYGVGKFFNSTTYGIRIDVMSRTGAVFRVRIARTK